MLYSETQTIVVKEDDNKAFYEQKIGVLFTIKIYNCNKFLISNIV